MSENNRQRVSIPIRGIDTSSTEINAPDGAMQELHNLRYSGEAWRNVKPFQVLERVRGKRVANKIFRDFDTEDNESYIVSQFPVASDINITAYWWDVDGEYTSTTSATLKAGMSRVHIEEAQESFGWIELNIQSDDKYLYYTNRDSVPEDIIGWEVVYQHPADEDDVYISKRVYTFDGEEVADLLRVRIKDGSYGVLSTIAEGLPVDVRISHFGNALMLSSAASESNKFYYINDGEYTEFRFPDSPIVSQSAALYASESAERYTRIHLFESANTTDYIELINYNERGFALPQFVGNFFWGEICFFAVYQMNDGRLISPSTLCISSSEPFYHGADALKYTSRFGEEYGLHIPKFIIRKTEEKGWQLLIEQIYGGDYGFGSPFGIAIQPFVSITIPEGIDIGLIKSVQIYSTRVNPIWDIGKILSTIDMLDAKGSDGDTIKSGFEEFYADNKLPRQPFYLMKTIPIKDFNDGLYEFHISSSDLENLEHATIYEGIDPHSYFFQESKEYNSRLHISGANQKLFSGYSDAHLITTVHDYEPGSNVVQLKINLTDYFVSHDTSANILTNPVYNRVISYPDSRAENFIYQSNQADESLTVSLTSAEANNFSFATNRFDKGTLSDFGVDGDTTEIVYVKYPSFFRTAANATLPFDTRRANGRPNRRNIVRVSAANNPFVFPLANSYAIGTDDNEIIALNSAAIEMSDAKFGEFPLYVFTKEGVFAMQSGSGEVLYGAIVPINYDKAINPNTLAVNHNVLYITDRGVHTLYSNEATLISEAINDAANQPLLDFLKTAKFAYQHKYGEVILFNTDRDTTGSLEYPRAYTFSLGAKVWGTRDWNGGVVARELLNSGDLIEQTENSIILSDLNNEDRDDTASFRLVSRPIKFNTQEFKRIETMVARLQASPAEYLDIKIEGSNDLVNWVTLRDTTTQTASDINIRRTPCSCRYFRVSIDCNTASDIAIMGFDFEYYMRFLHRMR